MASDPAFLFYPGDYLRDTQILSESVQVAYDRIMCEHMRNICISQQQLKFFTKRLTDDEILELKSVLTETDQGFQIKWVAESICKRRSYSESRRKNRIKKDKTYNEHIKNISKSYIQHMENENENEIENINGDKNENKERKKNFKKPEIGELVEFFKSKGSDSIQAHRFLDYYESNGWKVGRNSMKSWTHAASGWISRNIEKPVINHKGTDDYKKRSNSGVADYAEELNRKYLEAQNASQ